MNGTIPRIGSVILALLCIGSQTHTVFGMGMEAFGPAGERVGRSPAWPKDVGGLLSHPSRVYWRDVNGNENSFYQGGVSEINELLALFSKVELTHRPVVLFAGSPSATSFDGKKETPYSVEFHLPGGLYISHAKEYVKTGLFPTNPRLLVHVSKDWADDLAKLEVPENVTLYTEAYDPEQLFKLSAEGSDHRSHAIRLLGASGNVSAEAKTLFEVASKSDNKYISKAGQDALKQWKAASEPSRKSLQAKVTEFVEGHPQRYKLPSPEEVLEKLQAMDKRYESEGFTARGTFVDSSNQMMNWTVTMGNENLVIQQTAVEEDATGRILHTLFKNDERMGSIRQSQMWLQGKLNKTNAFKSFEPVGSTYDLLIGRMMWPLGRGFTSRIDKVTSVKSQVDGTLFVEALEEDGLKIRWELTIDPDADYVVRQAKGYRRDATDPKYIVDAVGVFTSEDRSTNHTSRWIEGKDGQTTSFAVTSVSDEPDVKLIFKIEQALRE